MAEVNDIASERLVLAGLVQYGNDIYLDISDILTPASFHNSSNKIVYLLLQHVLSTSAKVDLASILAAASELKLYDSIKEKAEIEYIKALFTFNVEKENVRKYAVKLRKLEIIRTGQSLIHKTYNSLQSLNGTESVDRIINTLESPIFEFTSTLNETGSEKPENIWSNAKDYLDYLANNPIENMGVPSPYPRFNKSIGGGFRRGNVSLLGARSKVGKTTVGKEIAIHTSLRLGFPTLYLDTEMSKSDILHKSVASITGISIDEIESGKFGSDSTKKNLIYNELERIKKSPFYYVRVAGLEFDQILSIMRRWLHTEVKKDANGVTNNCLVIFDYMKLMNANSLENLQEYQAIGFMISRLADFCKEHDFPCLSFVQLNRDGINNESSASISASDRLIWLCQNFSIFKPKSPEEIAEDGGLKFGNRKLVTIDTRFGPGMMTGEYINMSMDGRIGRVTEGIFKSEINKQNNEF